MTLNNFLLSTFATKTKFGTDIQSLRLRYQVLSIIYINLTIAFSLIIYDSFLFFTGHPSALQATTFYFLFASVCFTFLRQGQIAVSSVLSSFFMTLTNLAGSNFGSEPILGLFGMTPTIIINFFFVTSPKLYAVTMIPCIAVLMFHVRNTARIFQFTMDNVQSDQINALVVVAPASFLSVVAALVVQKIIEVNVWEIAQTNYTVSEALTQEVLQASKAKDTFVSSLSHEIRNPLNALRGTIDYLLEVVKDEEHSKMLKNAKLSCEMILNLANNVLDAAKLRSDKMELSFSPTDFSNIIKKILVVNSEVVKVKNIYVKAVLDRALPKILWVDNSRMLQVMMNLMSNALKFTSQSGKIELRAAWYPANSDKNRLLNLNDDLSYDEQPNPQDSSTNNQNPLAAERNESTSEVNAQDYFRRIRNLGCRKIFRTRLLKDIKGLIHPYSSAEPWIIAENTISNQGGSENRGYLQVQISDTGCGIAQENISKLFQMFTQAHKGVSARHGGTGLGLWICKQLCQKMGGDIKIYSKLEEGTTFVFYIPVNNQEITSIPTTPTSRNDRGALNVLIADDYAYNRDLHKLLVEREGAQTVMACNGMEAFQKFKAYGEGFFSFIMMDVNMHEMDGFTSAKLIRQWEMQMGREKRVEIYFVTGEYFDHRDVLDAFRTAGGAGNEEGIQCMRKPIDLELIRTTVMRHQNS